VSDTEQSADKATAAGRECGTCTMCCKVVGIRALQKPRNVWCSHCKPGTGCGTYDTRPAECREFFCGWIQLSTLGPEWRPDRSKLVLAQEANGSRFIVHCDSASPGAWRREPFYSSFKTWIKRSEKVRLEIIVMTGKRVTLLAPEGEFDLGEGDDNTQMVFNYDANGRLVTAAMQPKPDAAAETSPDAKAAF
jgi:hypothetical protein